MIRLWARRYLAYCVAMVLCVVVATIVPISALTVLSMTGASPSSTDFLRNALEAWIELGLSIEMAEAVGTTLVLVIGSVVALPVFRYISALGWSERYLWRHHVVGVTLFLGLTFVQRLVFMHGLAPYWTCIGVSFALWLTIGFAWHVYALKRAEANATAKLKATFA